ncbi:MAG: 2-phospho-L-lactate guanylyltransferase [Gammaproteobacteria bacterium]|nr:2-phospho-L-lactate guanylyltransferase [Gammaproteobacteria bacterium]NIM73050.1 2-phospho-L-lactate guanylyltransferase [Gammaproteobacteria bacterium]NIN38667.1 2-phospho-L-lactate guanylyltransferase [Gammaproteobacteria bacterium]NIO24803.1 2-phospho-L-lactate guanylyltransferase [Gammaproteobacteria bacterium]NIO65406.1 2-phospho-L-lactate guanylyltransferase [Gammaproteobacteria bacterium]
MVDSSLWVVMPVKNLEDAKQRLAGVLSGGERRALFRAMLEDVLSALSLSTGLAGVVAVTRDDEAAALAARYGARVLEESANRGHTAASRFGAAVLADEGVAGMVQLPADVPLVTPEDIEALLQAHGPAPAVTLAPSRDQRGTNAVVCSPPDVLPLGFGDDSFFPHLARARSLGIEPPVVRRPGLALDIDTREDLLTFLATPSSTRTRDYLLASGIAERLRRSASAQSAAP